MNCKGCMGCREELPKKIERICQAISNRNTQRLYGKCVVVRVAELIAEMPDRTMKWLVRGDEKAQAYIGWLMMETRKGWDIYEAY